MKKNIKIGIIGGMGANASAHFLQILIDKTNQNKIKMPEFFLDSISIDDFISDDSKIDKVISIIKKRINNFNLLKINMAVMACNTAHIIYPQISKGSKFYFPSLIDLVVENIKKTNVSKVGILATPSTIKHKLYEDKLNNLNIETFNPSNKLQSLLEKNIRGVINSSNKNDINILFNEIEIFIKQNQLDGIILGCTELPIIFSKIKCFSTVRIFDSLDILANSVIKFLQC